MNFSIGFYVSGQVLAGILGSTVTFGYGADGKHGANYIQTIAASVAQMSAMAVVLQAMVWLGLPKPPVWKALLYLTRIGLFGVGVGMLLRALLSGLELRFLSGPCASLLVWLGKAGSIGSTLAESAAGWIGKIGLSGS